MAYNDADDTVVLFGGYSTAANPNYLDDTWVWDGTGWTRSEVAGPPARAYAGMAYDGTTVPGRVLLYGGYDGKRQLGDTWAWDGTTWTELQVPGPPPRQSMAMAPDRDKRIVLFGGARGAVTLDETWLWDGSSWSRAEPAHKPGPQYERTMAYHAGRRETILLHRPASGTRLETWAWDGTDWIPRSPGPPDRTGATLSYDARNDELVMFGGTIHDPGGCGENGGFIVTSCPMNDTWTWREGNWTVQDPDDAPGPKDAASSTSNPRRSANGRSVVLFGGLGSLGPSPCSDQTWTWDSGLPITTTTSSTTTSSTSTSTTLAVTTTSTSVAVVPAPVVLGVEPNVGSTEGGELVTVRGRNLDGARRVRFGPGAPYAFDCPGPNCTINSDTDLSVKTPAHEEGTVHVVVFTLGGSSAPTDADQYTFVAPQQNNSAPGGGTQAGLTQPPEQSPLTPTPPGGAPAGAPVASGGLSASGAGTPSGALVAGGNPAPVTGLAPGASPSAVVPSPGSATAAPAPGAALVPQPAAIAAPAAAPPALAGPAGRTAREAGSLAHYLMVGRSSDPYLAPLLATFGVALFTGTMVCALRQRRPRYQDQRA